MQLRWMYCTGGPLARSTATKRFNHLQSLLVSTKLFDILLYPWCLHEAGAEVHKKKVTLAKKGAYRKRRFSVVRSSLTDATWCVVKEQTEPDWMNEWTEWSWVEQGWITWKELNWTVLTWMEEWNEMTWIERMNALSWTEQNWLDLNLTKLTEGLKDWQTGWPADCMTD